MPTPTDNMTAFQLKQELRQVVKELRALSYDGPPAADYSGTYVLLHSRKEVLLAALAERGLSYDA